MVFSKSSQEVKFSSTWGLAKSAFAMRIIIGCAAATALAAPLGPKVTITPGIEMTTVNLGTCCGSDPSVGLRPWLKAGGTGIDTAFDYGDQSDIGKILREEGIPRDSLFITSKIPAGFGNETDCTADPNVALRYARENLREIGLDYFDLLLLHAPCGRRQPKLTPAERTAANAALWQGMVMAREANMTRAIGVSNYVSDDLEKLPEPLPAVNQCNMGVSSHDDDTITYCQEKGILYEAFRAMHGCPFGDERISSIAKGHNVSDAQVCLRYVLDKGVAVAVGTGSDPEKSAREAVENLDVYGFSLTTDEFAIVDAIQDSTFLA